MEAQHEPGSGQKRPAEGQEADLPSKAARLEPHPAAASLPDSLPGTANGVEGEEGGLQPPGLGGAGEPSLALLQQQLADALVEAARWREECEGHRRRLEADGPGAEAKAAVLQAELGESKKQVEALKAAAKRDGQRIQQLELQLKQAQSDARHAAQQAQQLRLGQQHRPPNIMLPSPPPPSLPPQPHRMPHGGPGQATGYPGAPPPPGAAASWPGQQPHYGYGGQQQQQQQAPPGQPGAGGGGYYDWSGWGQGGQQQPQGGGEYWAAAGYQAQQGAAAQAGAPPSGQHHAPYYSQAADQYASAAQGAGAGAYTSPVAPTASGPAAAAPVGAAAAPRSTTAVDEEQIWWELDQRKRDVIERFARSYPAMVSPADAMRLCISDFREMTDAQLEGFFLWLAGNCNPSRPLKAPGGFVRVKHTEWKKLHGL